ncbi:hypothetical protein SAMN04489841_3377 [Natrinema salaciae]|uniref:Uncharacterized protein n=1 Tax=Natrinema salaciae TaxID=1186196 RepID=A0A1H9MIM6_9EURY|nr:hypothetical protein SAMN04489841_3377 [Natrinema salaciae]
MHEAGDRFADVRLILERPYDQWADSEPVPHATSLFCTRIALNESGAVSSRSTRVSAPALR